MFFLTISSSLEWQRMEYSMHEHKWTKVMKGNTCTVIATFCLITVSWKTVRFYENKTEQGKVLSIKYELHSSLHVLWPHLFSVLCSGCTRKCTESTSIIYCILCFQNIYTLLKIKLHAIYTFWDYFIFLLPIFKKSLKWRTQSKLKILFWYLWSQGFRWFYQSQLT
jgi:hypothetical protein